MSVTFSALRHSTDYFASDTRTTQLYDRCAQVAYIEYEKVRI